MFLISGDLRADVPKWLPGFPAKEVCSARAGSNPAVRDLFLLDERKLKTFKMTAGMSSARLAQSVERQTLNLVVVGSSPTVGAFLFLCDLSSEKKGEK